MFTWTENPYETMWGHLRFLSHDTNTQSLLCGGLGSKRSLPHPAAPFLEPKARQVAYCILQAHEYYEAAEAVTIHTSPLLYFYGMLSLAKAAIVANEPTTLLDDVKYHGLRGDKSVLSAKLEEQAALTSGGVFEHLCSVVQGFSFPPDAAIRLKDVLSISPELGEMYGRYFGEPSRSVNDFDTQVTSTMPFNMRVSTARASSDEVLKRIPELARDFDIGPARNPGYDVAFLSKAHLGEVPDYFRKYEAMVGGRYLVGALPFVLNGAPAKHCLSPPLSDYVAMFILSDCVRYKQDLWGEVLQGRETGILGLIDLFLAVAKRRFPNLILDVLFGEHFDYGAPGRIS